MSWLVGYYIGLLIGVVIGWLLKVKTMKVR
jgi:uncharacterized protein YneF (UPF0154 family)